MANWELYTQAASVEDALEALNQASGPCAIIAGGTDLLLDLDQGRHPPLHTMVDVSGIKEMLDIREEEGYIFLGGAVTHTTILQSSLLKKHARVLVEACSLIGGPQVRSVATIGGNVAHALPAADGTIALLCLDAEVEIASRSERRREPLKDIFIGPGKPTFNRNREVLVGFRFPLSGPRQGTAFLRVMRPQSVAIAILNMGVWLEIDPDAKITNLRLALGPAGPTPLRALKTEAVFKGKKLDTKSFKAAIKILSEEVRLRTSPHRATKKYREHLLGILFQRTLETALHRANE